MLEALALICTAVDGDTADCGGVRYRLQAVDAPERPGTCRKGRVCAPGDYNASKEALRRLIDGKRVVVVDMGSAAWGRRQAVVYVRGKNIACLLLSGGWAIYKPEYDRGLVVKRECGL